MDVMDTLYEQAFPGQIREIVQVRRQVRQYLGDNPVMENVLLVVSELAANAALHSLSRSGMFIVRVRLLASLVHVEVQDRGGPWGLHFPDDRPHFPDDRPHGLSIVDRLAVCWGITNLPGGRVVWARIGSLADPD